MPTTTVRFCLLVIGTCMATVVSAHSGDRQDGALPLATQIDASIAVGLGWLCWMTAAFLSMRLRKPAAYVTAILAALSAVLVSVIWRIDAWIIASLLLTSWLYAAGTSRLWRDAQRGAGIAVSHVAYFCIGIAVLIIALLSPVDTLGEALFAMHMVQHELMMLVAAPLLVVARPLAAFIWAFPATARQRIGRMINLRAVRKTWRMLNQPMTAWSLHSVILWAWHFPTLFQSGLANETIHTVQHVSFLLSALLFWSSLIGPAARLRSGNGILYLLTSAIHTGMLGALLTFSPRAWYPAYAGKTEQWGLTALEDQQLGGLIMWVPAGFVFIFAGLLLTSRMLSPEQGRAASALTQPRS